MPKSDDEEFTGYALHVTQMKGFEPAPPPADERPQTVWHMTAAADESSKSKKTTKQSSSGAAHAEQEK